VSEERGIRLSQMCTVQVVANLIFEGMVAAHTA
jgi:hypothetical protein